MMTMASPPDERLPGCRLIELDKYVRPGTADAEGNCLLQSFCRRVRPLRTDQDRSARQATRGCDLLFSRDRQCDNFVQEARLRNNLLGAQLAVPGASIVEHLAEPDSVVVGGLSPAAEGSFPRCLQRRCPFDKVGDRICNVEAQTQLISTAPETRFTLRCQNIVVLG